MSVSLSIDKRKLTDAIHQINLELEELEERITGLNSEKEKLRQEVENLKTKKAVLISYIRVFFNGKEQKEIKKLFYGVWKWN